MGKQITIYHGSKQIVEIPTFDDSDGGRHGLQNRYRIDHVKDNTVKK